MPLPPPPNKSHPCRGNCTVLILPISALPTFTNEAARTQNQVTTYSTTTTEKKPCKRKKHKIPSTTADSSPSFCHVFLSNSGASSQQTRSAAGANVLWSSSQLLPRNTVRNRKRAYHRKRRKRDSKLDSIPITPEMERAAAVFSTTFLAENVVVFEGGINCSTTVSIQ
jgi:hypothetical protein